MNGMARIAAPYALTVKVVVNGSVTPKVISFLWPLGSGLPAISSSRWFCQKASARATAKITRQTTSRWRSSSRCSTRLSWSSWLTARTRRGRGAIERASGFFVRDDLCRVGFGPGGRRPTAPPPGALRLPDRLPVGVFDGVVVLVLAGARAFELADAFAQAVAELRKAFGAEHDQR